MTSNDTAQTTVTEVRTALIKETSDYSADALAWFRENYADTEWMVHVQGPDDCHTHVNPDLDEDDPANALFTEATARKFAADVLAFNDWYRAQYPAEGSPNLIPTVFHWGVPAEPETAPPITGQTELPVTPAAAIPAPDSVHAPTAPDGR